MKAGNETEIYKQGYKDGYNDGENARIDPNYWDRLTHQAAIIAMQGLIAGGRIGNPQEYADYAVEIAHALVEKLKEKEE